MQNEIVHEKGSPMEKNRAEQLLIDGLTHLSLPVTDQLLERFNTYMNGVLTWNEKVNLTAIREPEEFVKKHFIDSLLCCGFPELTQAEYIVDVGTGAGFPGIPLAMIYPEKKFVLMDSLNKKIQIIRQLAEEIGLQNVSFYHGRVEDMGRNPAYREAFDLCVSRAVANLAVLSEYCLPLVKPGGWFAPYKSGTAAEEVKESQQAIRLLGGEYKESRSPQLPGFDFDHPILLIQKVAPTAEKYPRKAGKPASQPLK